MSNHSAIGASSAHRWFNCPGSVALAKKAPPQKSSEHARRGTAAHFVLDVCLRDDVDPWDYLGGMMDRIDDPEESIELEEEDIEAVEQAIEMIKEEMQDGEYTLLTEIRIELTIIHPNLFGTADIVLISKDYKKIKVIDYKHGKGVPVDVTHLDENEETQGNLQLMYYGLGAINWVSTNKLDGLVEIIGWEKAFKEVHIGIIQPRCRHSDGPKRMWQVPNKKLQYYADLLKQKAKAVEEKHAPLYAGSHCRWCPAMTICPQITNQTSELAKVDFTKVSDAKNLNFPSVISLDKDNIAKLLRFEPVFSDWLKQIKELGRSMLMEGKEVPGFKLVQKKSNRKWEDEEEAQEVLLQYLTPDEMTKLITPAQVEKKLSKTDKKIVKDLCYKPDGGLTMVPEHDKREAVSHSATEDFELIN